MKIEPYAAKPIKTGSLEIKNLIPEVEYHAVFLKDKTVTSKKNGEKYEFLVFYADVGNGTMEYELPYFRVTSIKGFDLDVGNKPFRFKKMQAGETIEVY